MVNRPTGRRRGFRAWFVEPYRQVKLGLMFLVINLIFSILIFGLFGYYVWDMYQTISVYFELNQIESSTLLNKFITPTISGALLIVIFVITTIMVSVRYTYQIYGPLVSIHRFIDDLLSGEKPEGLHLRESDQLKDLAEKLNSLSERYGTDQRQNSMVPIYRFIDEALSGSNPKELKLRDNDQLSELVEKLNKLVKMKKS